MSRFLLSLVATLCLTACEEGGPVGGDCAYEDTHGTCTFVDAAGGADVTFDFVSDDGTVTDSDTLVVGDGGTPPTQACVDELGIAAGVSVGCSLRNITSGTCTPVIFAFDDFDTNECLD
jgi:hypothetical protein